MLALLLLPLAIAGTSAQAPNLKDIRTAVEEYVAPETSEKVRAAHLQFLRGAPNFHVVRLLKPIMRQDDRAERSLDLAIALRLTGLFSTATEYWEDYPQKVAGLGLATNEKDGFKKVIEKWEKAEPDSKLFEGVQAALMEWPLDLTQLKSIKEGVCGRDQARQRVSGGLDIIEKNLGRRAANAEELETVWEKWFEELKDDARRHKIEGIDGFQMDGWRMSGVDRLCGNFVMEGNGSMTRGDMIANDMNNPPYTMSLWFKASEDFKGNFSIVTDVGGRDIYIGFLLEKGRMYQQLTETLTPLDVRRDLWIQIQWVVVDGKGSKECNMRMGHEILRNGVKMEGKPRSIEIKCDKGKLIVGGLDYVRN